MKILVTGGAGFVGSTLCRYLLEKGHEVVCFDNLIKGGDSLIPLATNPNFTFVKGDITKRDDVRKVMLDNGKIEGIIHLAAIVGAPDCEKNPSYAANVNIEGAKNILWARQLIGLVPLAFASTGSVYGQVDGICDENSPLNPKSDYGIQKKIAEELIEAENNTCSFRFATAFGPSPNMRVNLLANDFAFQAHTNSSLVIFQAQFRRTFIHVRDMARAFLFAIENMDRLRYKVYNCGSNELNCTKRELADMVADEIGCFVFEGEIGVDPDQRDYEVSYDRLAAEGYKISLSLEDGIKQLAKVVPLLQIKHHYD